MVDGKHVKPACSRTCVDFRRNDCVLIRTYSSVIFIHSIVYYAIEEILVFVDISSSSMHAGVVHTPFSSS